ncbi:MAG: hypothetical protein KAJ44_00580 [Thermoplasmatales archaeon]|nr:hypothetical protein [Thermoplasmatales archaeon]
MNILIVAILLSIIIGIVQYFSERISNKCGSYYTRIISFSAGLAITYLFLDLIPQFSINVVELNEILFVFLLVGFTFVHLVEKYIYQHTSEAHIEERLTIENQATLFLYHFIIGTIIVDFTRHGLNQVILFFIPIVIFTAVSTLPVKQHVSNKVNFFVALSTLFGAIFSGFIFTEISPFIQTALLGFIVGGLLFSVIRHSIPKGREGEPLYFILGVLLYASIIIASWNL